MKRLVAAIQQWLGVSAGTSIVDAAGAPVDTHDGGRASATDDGVPRAPTGRTADTPAREEVYCETGLTPEEYLLSGLEAHDGRLRQQAICDWTGWSEPTVSRLLTSMEDDGAVVRYQIGREKVVCLPDETL